MPLYTRILFFLLCSCSFSASAQVVAGFTASPLSGCAPLIVSFTNTSAPVIGTTYKWDLGNSTGLIALTNPSTSYVAAGTYTVTLTATNGGISTTTVQVITVYPQPSVSFTTSDTALCPGAPFTFTSTGTAGMAGGLSYLWSFGDGYTATTSPAVHAYGLPGRFNVSLTLTNAAGCSNTLARSSLIHAYTPPVPLFSANTRHVCKHSGSVSFTSSPIGTAPFTYRWGFGDGSAPSLAASPSHFYASPGYYAVKLVVADGHGCMDSLTQPAYISVTALTAAFTGPDTACLYTPATFVNTSANGFSALWMYGDGIADTTGSHAYNARAHYSVRLVASDSFCHDTTSRLLIVAPVPAISISPTNPCPPPLTTTLNATVAAGSTVSWHFYDGTVSTGDPVTHFYASGGEGSRVFDTINIYTTSPQGCRDTTIAYYKACGWDFDIRPIMFEPRGGCVPFTINVSQNPGFPAYACSSFKYAWDFGDGSSVDTMPRVRLPSGMPFTSHTFTATGIYPVKLIMATDNGCLGVKDYPVPVGNQHHVTFTATPLHECYNNNLVAFTRTVVSGTADAYFWLFGEGVQGYPLFDSFQAPTYTVFHHFTVPDSIFSDTLIAYDRGCPDTFIKHNYITIDSPKARAVRTILCSRPRGVFFQSISDGADSVWWLFGDGTGGRGDTATHIFPANATYTISVIAYNARSGCRDTDEVFVDLTKPVVSITASDTILCRDGYVLLSAHAISGQTTEYQWLIGGSYKYYITDDRQVPIFADTFHVAGRYTLKLVVMDVNTCTDTITKNNYILVAHPALHVAVSPGLCWPQTTVFTDTATDQPGISVINHVWAFGDGAIAATAAPSITHVYSATGNYMVKEFVSDNLGCFDSGSVVRTLYSAKSLFTASAHGCRGIDVPFVNWSTPSLASYLWSFGDGAASIIGSQSHMYTDTGHYTVKLFVTDPHGCRDTSSQVITVTHPHAAFSLSDSVGICPPLTVSFSNSSLRSASYRWNLGNGTSVAKDPVNVYPVPGFDTVSLIAIDSFGCRDTAALRHVKVFGYSGAFTYSATSGCIPLAITFDANLSNTALASAITWDFRDGVTSPPSLSDTVTHRYLIPGGYVPQLIIRDHSGCSSFNIGRDTIKVDGVTPGFEYNPDPVCIRNKVHLLDTSKSYWSRISSWRWTIGGVVTSRDTTSAVFSVAGTYPAILHVTDAWGCSADDTQTITVYALPAITPDAMLCTRQTMIFADSVTGGAWSSGSPAVATVGSASGMATGISAGIASITYTVGGTCYTTIAVTVNAYPDSGIISGDSAVCLGASVQLSENITGGIWSVSNTNASISSSGMLKAFTAGKDTVMYTVTNAGCSTAALKEVIIFPLPDPGTISGKDTLCRDAMTSLIETDTTGYWSSGSPSVAAIDSSGHIHGLIVGSTTITFTAGPDLNGCINTAAFPVVVINTDITVTPAVTGVKCYDERDGSITLTINSGTPPFNVVWSTGDTTSALDSLPAGAYSVIISEPATNCTLQQSFIVPSPDSLRVTAEVINDVCERPNGSIKLIPQGGTSPYHFAWSNKSVAAEIANIPSGAYACTITDLNGCTTQFAITVVDSTCPDIIIHDGVSPNGDGINDTWVIEGLWRYPGNVAKLFDKWGDEIFEESNYKNDWNGSSGKGPVPDGTYYYLLKLNSPYPPHGKDAYTGSLLLKR